jgi:hypothetical protein
MAAHRLAHPEATSKRAAVRRAPDAPTLFDALDVDSGGTV